MFSRKCDPSQSILPVRKASKCSDKTVFQTTTRCLQAKGPLRSRAFVLRLRYFISRAHQVKYSSCSCETFRPLSPSHCMHKLIHKQCWHNPIIHLVLTSRACFFSLHDNLFYLFRYSLISIHSVEKNSTITAVVVIPNTLWLNAPMFNTYDVGQMWHWWGTLQTTLCFPVTAQPDWLMNIPLGQMKTLLNCYTSFRLICNSAICSGMWDDM